MGQAEGFDRSKRRRATRLGTMIAVPWRVAEQLNLRSNVLGMSLRFTDEFQQSKKNIKLWVTFKIGSRGVAREMWGIGVRG